MKLNKTSKIRFLLFCFVLLRNVTQRNATQRRATQRNAAQRHATQRYRNAAQCNAIGLKLYFTCRTSIFDFSVAQDLMKWPHE